MSGEVIIDYQVFPDAPVRGAVKVWWLVEGVWRHKGWLMPMLYSGDADTGLKAD